MSEMKTMKDYFMEMNDDNIDPEKVKKTKKDKAYATYRVAEGGVSGCDLVLERVLNGKVTHQMFLLPSQGIYRRKEMKTGEIYTLDSTGFKRFFDGLRTAGDVWECPESEIFCEFRRGDDWVNQFFRVINTPVFRQLAKANLVNTRVAVTSCINRWSYDSTWFGRHGFCDSDALKHELADKDLKLVKKFVALLEERGLSHVEAINKVYPRDGGGHNTASVKYPTTLLSAFIIIAEVYSPEFSISCMEEYIDNDLLFGLDSSAVERILLCKKDRVDEGYNNYGYYRGYQDDSLTGIRERYAKYKHSYVQFEPKRFWEFLANESIEIGQCDDLSGRAEQWRDTLESEIQVFGEVIEKYPTPLCVWHDKLAYRVRNIRASYDKQGWEGAVRRAAEWEVTSGDWILTYPRTPDDLLDEAQQMSNCVASYRERVIRGECLVLFLRKKDQPKTSVCTVEVRNGKVVQFRGRRNCDPTSAQREALDACVKKKQARDKKALESTQKEVLDATKKGIENLMQKGNQRLIQ